MYNCTNCNKYFTNIIEYNNHINNKDKCFIEKKYICKCCNKIYTKYGLLDNKNIENDNKKNNESNIENVALIMKNIL